MAETNDRLEESGRPYSLTHAVDEFMSDVDLLEDGGKFKDLNLLGGGLNEKNRATHEENKAKRQLATEGLVKIMGKLFVTEELKDASQQQSFMELAKKHLQLKGLKDLNELYLFARGGDKLMTQKKVGELLSKLKTEFNLIQKSEGQSSSKAASTQAAVKGGVRKAMKSGGLELDAATAQQLGLQQASNPEHFARRVGAKTAFPMNGNKRTGGMGRAA